MKSSFLLPALISLLLLSCKKSTTEEFLTSIEGAWKMIRVLDNATNTSSTKSTSIHGNVIITFVPNNITTGSFSGQTPSNDITDFGSGVNTYTLGQNQSISIPVLSMTKVGETSWGKQFVDTIRDGQQYSFEKGGKLNFRTPHKILIFKKQ